MAVKDTIMLLIETEKLYPNPVTEKQNLYTDLGFDSLAFTGLLVKIEDAFSVTFDITEMKDCLQIDELIAKVEKKLREVTND